VLAGASFFLGLAGHQQSADHSITTAAIVLAAGFSVLSGLAYSRSRLSGPAVAAVLLGNQIVLHVGLTLGSAATSASDASHGGHGVSGLVPSPLMILAHLVATILTAVVIVVVEASYLACVALLAWFNRLIRLAPHTPPALRRAVCIAAFRHPLWHSRPPGAVPGRGPPALVA
jgi:hypothetical protein